MVLLCGVPDVWEDVFQGVAVKAAVGFVTGRRFFPFVPCLLFNFFFNWDVEKLIFL